MGLKGPVWSKTLNLKGTFGKQGSFSNTQVNTWILGVLKIDWGGSVFEISDFLVVLNFQIPDDTTLSNTKKQNP